MNEERHEVNVYVWRNKAEDVVRMMKWRKNMMYLPNWTAQKDMKMPRNV